MTPLAKKTQKTKKKLSEGWEKIIKLRVFSDRLSVSSHGGGGGGGSPVLMREEGDGQQWGGWDNIVVRGRALRAALHTISIRLQNSLS